MKITLSCLKEKIKVHNHFKKFIIFLLNFIIIIFYGFIFNKIKNKKLLKVCLCVIGKRENRYVKEFVEHYKKIGYNKIFIYDNNEINDEKFEDVIQDEIDKGFVSIINYRGLKASQGHSYKDCYKNNNKNYDWLSFYDFDEFLELNPPFTKIQDYLRLKEFKKCQNIKINWIIYGNKTSLYYENKPLEQRFTTRIKISKCIKSCVRGNLPINYWSRSRNPHTSLNKFISCSSSGKIANYSSSIYSPPDIKFAYLKHYHDKSFEEFCIKIKRGNADSYNLHLNKKLKKIFEKNKKDANKLKIMERIFNISTLKKSKNLNK
jgi:L-rhamnose mutarotase